MRWPRWASASTAVQHDSMLYSYLLDPTYSSHALAEVALRRFNLKLSGTLAESADITGRLSSALRAEVEQPGLSKVYEEIDMPLVPVLARMEQAGVKIDCRALANMSVDLEREIRAKEKEIHEVAGTEFNVGSPKQLGRRAFQPHESAQAGEVWQGTHDLYRRRCARGTG